VRGLFFVFLATVAAGQTPGDQNQTGGIRGIVVDSVTHQPVAKAVVSIAYNVTPEQERAGLLRLSPVQPVTTDAGGSFAMERLGSGLYEITVKHRNYPQGRMGGAVKSIVLKEGEEAGPITVELTPGAAVSGQVLDEDGDPLPGCTVRIQPAKTARMNGELALTSPGAASDYRLYGIMPGRFYLTAECETPVFQPRPLSDGPDPPPSAAYPKLYYPSANTVESAEVLELRAGQEKTRVDFRMKPTTITDIHAVLAPSADWRGRTDLQWQLVAADQNRPLAGGWRRIDTSRGGFNIEKVFPGSYHLLVVSAPAGRNAGNAVGNPAPLLGAVQQIDVRDKPVETLIDLRHGLDVNGIVTIEGADWPNKVPLNQVHVRLVPDFGADATSAAVNNDGTFTVRSAFPGFVWLMIDEQSAFVKSVWLGGKEVTGGRLDLSAGAQGSLQIVVSTNTASIRGSARPGLNVAAVLSADTPFFPPSWATQADQTGQFSFDGLAPGKYLIGVVEQPGSPPDDGAREVTLREGQILVVDNLNEPR
jgi:hypothetical protein